MEAATRVFNRDGFRGATLDDVAAEIGISKSLIYYHFKNKMELLAELYKRVGTIFYDRLLPVLKDEALGHEERLRRLIETHVQVVIENKSVFEIYFRERNEIPADTYKKVIGAGEHDYVDKLTAFLDDGVAQGVFQAANTRITAFAIVGACNWITFWFQPKSMRRKKHSFSAREVADAVFQTIDAGILIKAPKKKSK